MGTVAEQGQDGQRWRPGSRAAQGAPARGALPTSLITEPAFPSDPSVGFALTDIREFGRD